MSKVITVSRRFPAHHPRRGEPTDFVEKIYNHLFGQNWSDISPVYDIAGLNYSCRAVKAHTVRKGTRWTAGEMFSLRVWSGKPYRSRQIKVCQDVKISRVDPISIYWDGRVFVNNVHLNSAEVISLAEADGLSHEDFMAWFDLPTYGIFEGQIIHFTKFPT